MTAPNPSTDNPPPNDSTNNSFTDNPGSRGVFRTLRHEAEAGGQNDMTQHVRRMWTAWMSGNHSELERILIEQPAIASRPEDLADLVYSEYWLRKQIDESVTEQEYLARFPQIADVLATQFAVRNELKQIELELHSSPTTARGLSDTEQDVDQALHSIVAQAAMVPEGYEPLALLGVGGMGVVIKAKQTILNREVAVKSLKSGAFGTDRDRQRLRKEALIVAHLKHPNIVQIYDVVEQQGRLFLIMECVRGSSLSQEIAADRLATDRVVQIVYEIAAAIHAAHTAGFLHRDIKPSNVLLDQAGVVKVTDFGLARASCDESLTMSGELVGTPMYMSPEQVRGTQLDFRSDIYSIGATLYQLLTGRPPFVGSSPVETLQQILHADPPAPRRLVPSVPRDLESICMKCMEKQHSSRYPSAQALLDDLDRFRTGRPTLARPVPRLEKSRRWVMKNLSLTVSIAIGVASLLCFAVALTWFVTSLDTLRVVSESQDMALKNSLEREQLSSYYALAAGIQAKASEKNIGWTWLNMLDIEAAVPQIPNETEKGRLRQLLVQTATSFDVRRSAIVIPEIDPFGLAWSADAKWLAIGENMTLEMPDGSKSIVVHALGNAPQRAPKRILLPLLEPENDAKGPEGIRSLAFLDERRLAVGCRSGWIQFIDIETGAILQQVHGHSDWCFALHYDPARRWLVSGSRDHSVVLWNSDDYTKLSELTARGSVRHLTIVDNHLIALGAELDLFTLPEMKPVPNPSWHSKDIYNLKATRDGKALFVTSKHRSFFAAPSSTSSDEIHSLYQWSDESSDQHYIDMEPRGRWSSISGVESVRFLDMLRREEICNLPLPGSGAKYATYDPCLDCIWVTNEKQLLRYDLRLPALWLGSQSVDRVQRLSLEDRTDWVVPRYSSDGMHLGVRTVVAAHEQKTQVELKGRVVAHPIPANETQITHTSHAALARVCSVDANSETLGGSLWIVNTESGSLTNTHIEVNDEVNYREATYALSTDGLRYWRADSVAVDGVDVRVGRMQVFNTSDGRLEKSWLNLESAQSVRISGFEAVVCGEKRTVSISGDRYLRAYDSHSLEQTMTIAIEGKSIPRVAALSDDESKVYVGMQDGRVLCVNLDTSVVSPYMESKSEITALAVTGQDVLAIGNSSGEVELWGLQGHTPTCLCQIWKQHEAIRCLEFSKDDSQLAMLLDNQLGFYSLDVNVLRALLREYGLDWMPVVARISEARGAAR